MPDGRGAQTLGLRERKKQRTRSTLIDAAVELCKRQGFENTTVDQIAAIADVSPRTFSRYFPTKEAIALALVDEILDRTAVELARQPESRNHYEALMCANIAMAEAAKRAGPGELTAERLLCITGIIVTSSILRQASVEFRGNAIERALADRLGVDLYDRKVKLVSAVWGAVMMTALGGVAREKSDWSRVCVDDLIDGVKAVFGEFTHLTGNLHQPV